MSEKSMRERMLAGEPYIADDPVLAEESQRAQGLAHRINTMDPNDLGGRRELLEELLGGFGEHSEVRPPLHCDYGYQTTIGARTFVNWGVTFLDVAAITIGDDVQIGPNVQLLTADPPARAAAEARQVGSGRAHHDRGQRLARWWRDRLPRRDDRRGHGRGRRLRRHPGPSGRRRRGRLTGPGAPRALRCPAAQSRDRNRSASTTTRVISPAASTLPLAVSRALTVKRWRRPSS